MKRTLIGVLALFSGLAFADSWPPRMQLEMSCTSAGGVYSVDVHSRTIITRGGTRKVTIATIYQGATKKAIQIVSVRSELRGTVQYYENKTRGFEMEVAMESFVPTRTHSGRLSADVRGVKIRETLTCQN